MTCIIQMMNMTTILLLIAMGINDTYHGIITMAKDNMIIRIFIIIILIYKNLILILKIIILIFK